MKNQIAVILLCAFLISCTGKIPVHYVEDIKNETELSADLKADCLNYNGASINRKELKLVLNYNDTALVFVNPFEKLLYITDLKLNVTKFVDLKTKYADELKLRLENVFINKDTLFFNSDLRGFKKYVISTGELTELKGEQLLMASPYNIYFRENGNYVITHFGASPDNPMMKQSTPPAKYMMNKEAVLNLKKTYDRLAGRDFIIGAEITPAGKLVRTIRADKDYYGHEFGHTDGAYYFENGDKKYFYFEYSPSIIAFDSKEGELYRKNFPVNKNWKKPFLNDQKQLNCVLLNYCRIEKYKNSLLQASTPIPDGEKTMLVAYDLDFNPKTKVMLTDTERMWGYSILVCGSKLIVYSSFNDDKNIYVYSLDKLNL